MRFFPPLLRLCSFDWPGTLLHIHFFYRSLKVFFSPWSLYHVAVSFIYLETGFLCIVLETVGPARPRTLGDAGLCLLSAGSPSPALEVYLDTALIPES